MAIYHLSAQVISRKAGRSATAAAAYRAGEKIEDRRTGETFDYTRKGGVYGASILVPAGAPAWATDRAELWNQVELAEIRKDAQVCREIDVALPVELDDEQRVDALRAFVQEQFVDQGMIADVAFHDFDSRNPHAHIMLTMRDVGPEGFGKKNRSWNQRELIPHWRKAWENHANAALARAGVDSRIDHRSYEAQGLNCEPTQHMGPAVAAMERRKPGSTRIGQENIARLFRNEDQEHEQILIEVEEFYVEQLEIEESQVIVEIAKTEAAASRAQRALDRLQEVVPDMIRRTLGFMKEHGLEPPESVQKRLVERGYMEPPENPEKPPMTALEREFQQRQQRDDLEDDYQGPSM